MGYKRDSRAAIHPIDIANIRENKDESESDSELIAEVEQYKKILDQLHEIYIEVSRIYS